MGFNVALLAYTDGGPIDVRDPAPEPAPAQVVRTLFPRSTYDPTGEVSLDAAGWPAHGEVNVGSFAGGLLITTADAHLYNPSSLHHRSLKPALGRCVVLLTQRSANDMFAFGRWLDGELVRSLSVNPVGRVWESIGDPEPWEEPFWTGQRPVAPDADLEEDYPLPFQPLQMSDAALREVLHLVYESAPGPALIDPADVPLQAFEKPIR